MLMAQRLLIFGRGELTPAMNDNSRQPTSARYLALPPMLAPRGLYREAAAAYVGVSSTKFDAMVHDGRMPRPKRVDGRRVWDRLALDRAFDALPDDGGEVGGSAWAVIP